MVNQFKTANQFKRWRPLFALYIAIYLPWFFYLEKTINADTPGMHMIDIAFDHIIPFCEYFVIPYYFWFIYIVGSCVFLMFFGSNREFVQMALSLIIGMSTCLFICMIYPNGLELRPASIPDNLCGNLVASLYTVDTSFNVFPSIHVYNSIVIHIALNRCEALKNHRMIRLASLTVCVLICLSTMFLKQHSITDVFGACVLSFAMYLALYLSVEVRERRVAERERIEA